MEFICRLTLVKTISATIPKIVGTLIGQVVGIAFSGCRTNIIASFNFIPLNATREAGGKYVPREERMWRLFYVSILGTLPRITSDVFEYGDLVSGWKCLSPEETACTKARSSAVTLSKPEVGSPEVERTAKEPTYQSEEKANPKAEE